MPNLQAGNPIWHNIEIVDILDRSICKIGLMTMGSTGSATLRDQPEAIGLRILEQFYMKSAKKKSAQRQHLTKVEYHLLECSICIKSDL